MSLSSTIRKSIFWLHLVSGLLAGLIIAIMSITGIAIAFEAEILDWADREVKLAEPSSLDSERMTVASAHQYLLSQHPELAASYVEVPADTSHAYAFYQGRTGPFYVNPYTGAVAETKREAVHHWTHTLEEWHRFLGGSGEPGTLGRLVTGISNLALVILCITGLYLWFPRRWSLRAVRSLLWFRSGARGKARDFNWHNVFGFWSLPAVFLLAATAVPISFEWAHRATFIAFGDEPPVVRDFRMMAQAPIEISPHAADSQPLKEEALLATAQEAYPNWVKIGLPLIQAEESASTPRKPVALDVYLPDYMPNRAWLPVEVDPYSGTILRATGLQDRSPGLQARIWIRFIHTGAAFGFWGKLIASLACAAALVLVYTGFSLSYRRFFRKRAKKAA